MAGTKAHLSTIIAILVAAAPFAAAQSPEEPKGPAENPSEVRLYGQEAAICLTRARAAADKGVGELHALLYMPLAQGKSFLEEWTRLADVVCQDVTLYCNSAVDAAKDAKKEKKCQATDADMETLRSLTGGTVETMTWVFRKKGLEVAAALDFIFRANGILSALRTSLPAIVVKLEADLVYAMDAAASVHSDLTAGELTDTDLDSCVRGLEIAKRSVTAVRNVGLVRRISLTATMKGIAPDAVLASFRKASDGWVASDEGDGALIGAGALKLMRGWPGDLEKAITGPYRENYEKAYEEARPLIEGTFHQIDLFKNTKLEDLDKAIDPYLEECRAALKAREAFAKSQRDIDAADEAAGKEAAATRKAMEKASRLVDDLIDVMKNLRIESLYESDRRQYQDLGKRYVDAEKKLSDAEDRLEKAEEELSTLKATKVQPGSTPAESQKAMSNRHMRSSALRAAVERLEQTIEEAAADLEEIREEMDELRTRIRGTSEEDE
jgi:hypothetical protein